MSKKEAGTGVKREKSPVAEMCIFKESVKKENEHFKVYENFTINPSKLYILQEKPNNNIMLLKQLKKSGANTTNFTNEYETQVESEPLNVALISKLESINHVPHQKFQYPQTSSHEIGWHSIEKNRSPSPTKFTYPRKLCNETNYANDYFTMLKVSPYSNKFK